MNSLDLVKFLSALCEIKWMSVFYPWKSSTYVSFSNVKNTEEKLKVNFLNKFTSLYQKYELCALDWIFKGICLKNTWVKNSVKIVIRKAIVFTREAFELKCGVLSALVEVRM